MRIHSLAFRGVGPYRDPQHIDFTQLGASGLYLINGPTGAGKSTIIDCICFALYGRLASDDNALSRMRSDFARPTEPTEVDLRFETAAGAFRVIRTPDYMRAKEKGSGETRARATCRLFRIAPDGHEEAIATTVSSADHELAQVIGLTREQFVQTVVLPQGEFATFLNADTKDRAEVLKRIFNTELFERVADILREDAKTASGAKAAATEALVTAIHELAALTGIDEASRDALVDLASNRLDEDLRRALEGLTPSFASAVIEAERALDAAQRQAASADEARTLARAEADAQAAVARTSEDLAAATVAADQAKATLTSARAIDVGLAIDVDDALGPDLWRERATSVAQALGELQGMLTREREVLDWPTQEAAATTAIASLERDLLADQQRLADLPHRITEQQALVDARPTLEESTRLAEQRQHLAAVEAAYEQLDAVVDGLPGLEANAARALAEAERLDREAESAARAYRAGIAAELAVQLEQGAPCPVCGATDHPSPAHHTGEPVSFDDLDALRTAASGAHASLNEAQAVLRAARERIEGLNAAITTTREALTAAQAEAAAQHAELAGRDAAANAAAESVTRLRSQLDELTAQVGRHGNEITAQRAALDARAEAMKTQIKGIEAARGAFPSISARIERVQHLHAALTDLADRLGALATARAAHAAAEATRASMAARDGFADIAAAQSAWQEADDARLAADRTLREAETRLDQLRTRIEIIEQRCRERDEQIASSADLIELAELFASGRGSDVGLHIYVLQSLFANVMESANRRFESLLNGRYRLVRTPDTDGDRRSLQGLGVSVEDRLTGKARPAKSLSGGERFCASLALALGLSDVVRMTAGGIEIGSLFIDEGFGSLDGEQLEEVMLMLGHLSSDGRQVGVISHVESMKSAITERINVTAVGDERPTSLWVSWMA